MEEFQGDSNEEVYMLKTINWKLKAKYGDSLQFTSCEGGPLLCCSMKRQIKLYLKVHWRRCRIVVTLGKIWEASFSLAERLHKVGKKAVNVKNSILIQRPYSRKPFYSHSKEIIIFPRCYIYEVKDICCSRKTCERSPLLTWSCNGAIKRIPVTTSTCYRFVRSSKHKIVCSGWCSVRIGTFVIILGYIRFRKMCKCIHDRIYWYVTMECFLQFTDTVECFLQFIANNFDHIEDTTTGPCTTHVMDLISSKYPKSDILSTQPIMK